MFQVLPLAHVTNDKKQVTLINPQAVNLDAYKEKLEQAIKSYERRLNLIIWRALSQEERDKFEQDGPVSYMEHKEALLKALEDLGWPVPYEDVMLLEDEILSGLTYLQQASDLQEAAHRHLLVSQHKLGGLSKKRQKGKALDALKGKKVIARSEITGFYCPGTVVRTINSTHVLVDFTYAEAQVVPLKFIVTVGGAMPCPSLQYVFARIGTPSGNDYYVPAIVIATPNTAEAEDKLYTVLKYNNKKEHCVRSGLIKISQTKYAWSCRYIRITHMMDYLM
uniref:DUF4537 domain-containing protein n=1 Tax=Sphenodon punctatus TaxID=8508 RepID=A0A8D0GSW2_SPHPU